MFVHHEKNDREIHSLLPNNSALESTESNTTSYIYYMTHGTIASTLSPKMEKIQNPKRNSFDSAEYKKYTYIKNTYANDLQYSVQHDAAQYSKPVQNSNK